MADETAVVEQEEGQVAEAPEAEGAAPEAPPRSLIPNGLARDIFDARRNVVRCGTAVESASLVLKGCKSELAKAQARVMDLIQEAESGQSRLFDNGSRHGGTEGTENGSEDDEGPSADVEDPEAGEQD